MISKKTLQVLAQIADEFDQEGLDAEANVIDEITQNIVRELTEEEPTEQTAAGRYRTVEGEMSGKAEKALHSLDRALTSFLGKNLDSRSFDNRRDANKCVDLAEDLQECIQNILGGGNTAGA